MWATGECNNEMDKRRTMLQMQERRWREWRTRVRWSWKRSWRIDGAWRQEGQGRSKKRKEHVYSEVEDLGVCGTGKGGERMFSAGKRSGFPRAFGQRGWKEKCARQDARTWQDHLGLSVAQKRKRYAFLGNQLVAPYEPMSIRPVGAIECTGKLPSA